MLRVILDGEGILDRMQLPGDPMASMIAKSEARLPRVGMIPFASEHTKV